MDRFASGNHTNEYYDEMILMIENESDVNEKRKMQKSLIRIMGRLAA